MRVSTVDELCFRTALPGANQDELLLSSVGRRSGQWAADVQEATSMSVSNMHAHSVWRE